MGWLQTSLHSWNWGWCKKTCGFCGRNKLNPSDREMRCVESTSETCINCTLWLSSQRWQICLHTTWQLSVCLSVCLYGMQCHSPPAAEMQESSPYLSSSVCWARSCWAAARAAKLCAKLCWPASGPAPPGGACGWGSAEGWGTCPAPCPCPGASTGGKGGWKAGEVCCFLPKVLLPLRRVWSECLLGVLHREGGETVREKH